MRLAGRSGRRAARGEGGLEMKNKEGWGYLEAKAGGHLPRHGSGAWLLAAGGVRGTSITNKESSVKTSVTRLRCEK